jgi:phage-related protein
MASKSFGGTVKLTGESEYQKALRGIADNLKVLNSEMRVVTSQYDKNDNSSQKLKATSEVLNKKIAEQKSKIEVLKSALAQAEAETGKNSDTTKKWQMQLNNAEAELNDLNKELKDQHGNLEKSGEKALKLGDIIKGNLISEGIIAGVKGLGKAIGAVGSAFINVGKQAVQSYSQHEQLVGGVDTLFGESSKKVQEYASNAFKTSGMSANQYMETVTSFSASLISSLDGDTAKASEVANRAIIDMSDNANKMGTDISMIQNAYQGFAKQNYTMLDNLKLGYGGTKAEMERLVSEASQMTDVQKELGITVADGDMSFANIANAISVVQKNMGLMGTTASEASGTIAGSTGSMQSAWQNLITGIADDNANFEVLVDNLVTSIVGKDGEGGFITNMLPRIQQALDGIVTMVVSLTDTLLPQIVVIGTDLITNLVSSIGANLPALLESANTIINTLISGIVNLLPQLIPMAVSIILTLTTSILEMLPEILQAGITVLIELVKGITQALPELIPTMVRVVMDMVNILLDNIDVIIECGIVLLVSLIDGIMNALPELVSRLPEIIIKIVSTLMQLSPQLFSASLRIMVSLATGLIRYIPEMISRIPQIISSMVDAFKQHFADFTNIGKNLIEGIWNGISDTGAWLRDKVSGFFGGVVDDIKDFFGIHSPSTLFENEIGKNLALGVGEGFSSTMTDVSADMQGAIPTEFDTNVNMSTSSSYGSNYDYLVSAFKEALKDVKVVMNNREMGAFIVSTVEREVYA